MRIIFLSFFLLANQMIYGQEQPNILWIVCEDSSPAFSFYGDSTAKTPILDALAANSVIYDNAFSVVGVCAPSRSAIITGRYPISNGTMHMRTGKDVFSWGKRKYKDRIQAVDLNGDSLREYAVVVPDEVKCFTEYLRAAGYYCTNNAKTDYQFAAPITAWDENGDKAHWRNRPDSLPFFSVFNFGVTHESRIWKNVNLPLSVDPLTVAVPPYLPDNEITRKDIARHYSNLELLDQQVGKLLDQLKADSLYDKTIIFFYSDHGGPLPRQKREIYDSGLKVPFFVKLLNQDTQTRTDRLISFVDLAPTILSLAGISIPQHIQGTAFLGPYAVPARKYVYGSSDRFDEYSDRIRMIRDKRYLYLRNFIPELPKYKDISYRKNIPLMEEMLTWKNLGKLLPEQDQWFMSKSKEELYDCQADPHNLYNLAEEPAFQEVLYRMRTELLQYLGTTPDLGQLPEATLINMMWPEAHQPQTQQVEIKLINGKIELSSPTPGASIAYLWTSEANKVFDFDDEWQLYDQAIQPINDQYLYVIAERIGFQRSLMRIQKISE